MLSSYLKKLRSRIATSRNKNARRSAVALPVELLGIIFLFASSDVRHEIKERSLVATGLYPETRIVRQLRSPLLAVCSRWREIAISTTPLWNYIDIELTEPRWDVAPERRSCGGLVPGLRQLRLELERSGTRLIQLRLDVDEPPSDDQDSHLPKACREDLFEMVKAVLPRCKRLYLDLGSEALLDEWLDVISSTKLPDLTSFVGVPKEEYSKGRPLWDLSLAPRLQRLSIFQSINGLHLSLSSAITQLPLDLCVDFDVAVGILRSCNQLRQLHWGIRWLSDEVPRVPSSLALPFLEYLDYEDDYEEEDPNSYDFLSFLIAPRMTTLVANGYTIPTNFPTLLNLQYHVAMGLPMFIESLRHFPSLEYLKITRFHEFTCGQLLDQLRHRAEDGSWDVLPNLRHLDLDGRTDAKDIERLLEARKAGLRGDSGLTLAVWGREEDSVPSELEHLRHLGVVPFWTAYDPFYLEDW